MYPLDVDPRAAVTTRQRWHAPVSCDVLQPDSILED
jgi:hypothetical protein